MLEDISPHLAPPDAVAMLAQSLVAHSQPASAPHFDSPDPPFIPPAADVPWDNPRFYSADAADVVSWNYYTLPPSPPASVSSNVDDSPQPCSKIVRPRSTPEPHSDSEHHSCLPTNQVFELETPSSPSSASPPPSIPRQLTISSDGSPPLKKSFSAIGSTKRGRGNGERITTKDFVPPDVTGLSKREARLLKNRAAAFLSRQRKREEFEAMEIRVRELEEENSRLQSLAARGRKYDDLHSSTEQLRLRLSAAEKRERELTIELANQAATNLAIKTEAHDFNLPPSPYSSYAVTGQASVVTIMKQSLLSSLPSLLSLPSQASLPISFCVPLTGSSPTRSPSDPYSHHSAPCDIKDQGRRRFGHDGIGFHSSPVDIESSKKVVFGGDAVEDGLQRLSFSISIDTSPTEDGRGSVHVQISEGIAKPAIHGSRQRPPLLTSWSGAESSFGMTCYASPPLSAPVGIPSPTSMDHHGVFHGTGNAHSRMGFDTQLMPSGYTAFAQHDQEQSFDYYPGVIPE